MRKRHARRSDYDSPWKEALEFLLQAFLAFFFPQIHSAIDWLKGYRSLDKELHQVIRAARSGKALADKLFQVWRLDGREAWLLIHIEVQGTPEDDFPLRMFRYNTRAFDRYNRTVVSLAVLTDEQPEWRPERFDYGDWGASTGIRFLTTKLIDWRGREAELRLSANPFAHVVLAHLAALATRQDPVGRRAYKVRLVKGLYERGWAAEQVRQLFRVIDWLLELPSELQDSFQDEVYAWEQEHHMGIPYVTSVERSGIEKGLQQGLRKAIASALETRFGAPGRRLMAKVRKITDAEELLVLHKIIISAENLEAVRAHLTPGRR